ncbi:acyl-homoserine-lactone synthase [Paracoccus alkanivorans]|uniref:Acyl-homoserine-lactone synthase n=1 Tax=Paracoccus alkanivorans TaxID=2116655 RepID=A0A3M0M3U8_9RHOB|nr:acyl-homoserine-lactone synthase [Paracoccus alkanivorans]RMC32356.1 N-acyl-L-homoserine lactone (AHL) synthase [Paracoccus alkanivorans]
MFILIQPHEIAANSSLMRAMFRLRKRVFHDRLNWKVEVAGDEERDGYDDLGASYLVWCSRDRSKLYGAVRLMPTDGPTLLHDVFWATHGRNADLIGNDIWEGTRMCLNEELLSQDFPHMDAGRGFSLMLLALCEAALATGINRLVSNFEPMMGRVYRRAGVRMQMHGSADGYGRRPVCCASFAVSQQVRRDMQKALGVAGPLFHAPVPPMLPCQQPVIRIPAMLH